MIDYGSRNVTFARSRIRVTFSGLQARDIVTFVLRHIPEGPGSDGDPPHATFEVTSEPRSDLVTVRRDGGTIYVGPCGADAARALLEAASEALARESRQGLLLHAAAIAIGGRVVLLPGTSGSGKTTLTAALIEHDCRWLTDELSFVPDDLSIVEGLARPLHIKRGGRDRVAHLFDSGIWTSMASNVTTLLQPPASAVAPGQPLHMLVFPTFKAEQPVRFSPLAPAQCGLRVMGCLLNARNLPDHGFPSVAALARRIPSFSLVYGEASQAAATLMAHVG